MTSSHIPVDDKVRQHLLSYMVSATMVKEKCVGGKVLLWSTGGPILPGGSISYTQQADLVSPSHAPPTC